MPWEKKGSSEVFAIHAALLPTGLAGEILMIGGDQHNPELARTGHVENTGLYDCLSGGVRPVESPDADVFCCGHALLADGGLLIAGGTGHFDKVGPCTGLGWIGLRGSWIWRPRIRRWERGPDMAGTRWYPTLVTLANGQVFCMGGATAATAGRESCEEIEGSKAYAAERYDAWRDTWWPLLPFGTEDAAPYPRLHLLPDGRVFCSTPLSYSPPAGAPECLSIDPETGTPGWAAPFPGRWVPDAGPPRTEYELYGHAAVLLPLLPGDGYQARVLLCGGGDGGDEPPKLSAPHPKVLNVGIDSDWRDTAPRTDPLAQRRRQNACAVLLPTGEVMVSGGMHDPGKVTDDHQEVRPEDPTREVEIYDPGIDWGTGSYTGRDKWIATGEPAGINRNYHSVALLMPDGGVWTAGSNHHAGRANAELEMEVYRPPYYDAPDRPDIGSAPPAVAYGQSFEVHTKQAARIQRVALLRCGSVTHSFDADQRYVALHFQAVTDDVLLVEGPAWPAVAPPGTYMLWIVDTAGLPCSRASFVRVGSQSCEVVTRMREFSRPRVAGLAPVPGSPARFEKAFTVLMKGFLSDEVGPQASPPALDFFRAGTIDPVPGLSARVSGTYFSLYRPDPPRWKTDPDRLQLVMLECAVEFASLDAFDGWADGETEREVTLRVRHAGCECVTPLLLRTGDDRGPYILDEDLRVFKVVAGDTRAGVAQGTGPAAPYEFIQRVVNAFNAAPAGAGHPFGGLSEETLELGTEAGGRTVYNYAVARVRLRAPAGTSAADVRVFFRAFTTMVAWTDYDPEVYPRHGDGPTAAPLLGVVGGEVGSIPFLAVPRVDATGATSLADQPVDWPNVGTLVGAGDEEVHRYFGCWLDFNTTTPRFPPHPASAAGPYPAGECVSLQELVRGQHQCLVAEIHYPPDPIPAGAGTWDSRSLAQLNLSIVDSAGAALSTLLLRPSPEDVFTAASTDRAPPDPGAVLAAGFDNVGAPDELVIRWNGLPGDSIATLYLPGVAADEVIRAAGRGGSAGLERVDEHTVRCVVGGVSHVPIPGGSGRLRGLLSIRLPAAAAAGEEYRVTAQQVGGWPRRVVGEFQVAVTSGSPGDVLPGAERTLSVLRWVGRAIPPDDPWAPVWTRYLDGLADKVRVLGGDPERILPSPDGSGRPRPEPEPEPGPQPEPGRPRSHLPALVFFGVLALALLVLTLASGRPVVGIASLVVLLVAGWWWYAHGSRRPR